MYIIIIQDLQQNTLTMVLMLEPIMANLISVFKVRLSGMLLMIIDFNMLISLLTYWFAFQLTSPDHCGGLNFVKIRAGYNFMQHCQLSSLCSTVFIM